MNIEINGTPREVHADTLAALLCEIGQPTEALATAVNGAFVPATARDGQRLHAGDRVELLTPNQGG